MRKLLTWYAIYYNRRHKRTGHLFENRYKSILCEEDNYLLALLRYIHLNPLRVGLAKTLEELHLRVRSIVLVLAALSHNVAYC